MVLGGKIGKKNISSLVTLKKDEWMKSQIKEFIWPFLVFALVLILFKISSKFNFKIGLLFIFLVLLIVFVRNTKFLFYMFIISIPFIGTKWVFNIGFRFKLNYLFFTLLLISFFYNKFRKKDYSFTTTQIDTPLFLFLLVAAVSVFQTAHIGSTPIIIRDLIKNYPWFKGLMAIIFLASMFAVYYITVNIVSDKNMFKKTLLLLIITAVIVSLHGLIGFFFTLITSSDLPAWINPIMQQPRMRILSSFGEPLFLGNYLLSIFPVLYCLIIPKTKYFNRYFVITALLILTLTLFLTVSRGALFGYFIFLFLLIIIYWKKFFRNVFKKLLRRLSIIWLFIIKKFPKGIFIVLLLLALLLFVGSVMFKTNIIFESISEHTIKPITNAIFKPISESVIFPLIGTFDPSSHKFWSTRLRIWSIRHAWRGFKQHPLLGIGYSNYGFYSGVEVYETFGCCPMNFPEVNNYPMKILAETGLIGFIVFIWLFIKIVRSAVSEIINEKDDTRKRLITGYLLSFTAVSAQMMFFSYITLAYLWIMLAMMMSLCRTKVINLKRI